MLVSVFALSIAQRRYYRRNELFTAMVPGAFRLSARRNKECLELGGSQCLHIFIEDTFTDRRLMRGLEVRELNGKVMAAKLGLLCDDHTSVSMALSSYESFTP